MDRYKRALKYLITDDCTSLQEPCEKFFEDYPGEKLNEIIEKLTFEEGLSPSEFLYHLGYAK